LSLIKNTAWILFRIALYNLIGIALAGFLGIVFNAHNSIPWNENIFFFPQLVISLFLANLIYIVGNLLEGLHSKLWNTNQKLISREKQFFRASLIMIGIVNAGAIVFYFLKL
jgi:fructose-specific phosphotransferase system IIC component